MSAQDIAVHDETDDLLWEIHEILSALRVRGSIPAEKSLLITRDLRATAFSRVVTSMLALELDRVSMAGRRTVDEITTDLEQRCAEHIAMVRAARAQKRAERIAAACGTLTLEAGR